jgi:hypothetical protein
VIGLITGCFFDVVAIMGDIFILVCNFHVPLGFNVGCPSSEDKDQTYITTDITVLE